MITKIIDEALIQAAKERILDAENVVITTHHWQYAISCVNLVKEQ